MKFSDRASVSPQLSLGKKPKGVHLEAGWVVLLVAIVFRIHQNQYHKPKILMVYVLPPKDWCVTDSEAESISLRNSIIICKFSIPPKKP